MGFAYENALRHLGLLHICNMRLFSRGGGHGKYNTPRYSDNRLG